MMTRKELDSYLRADQLKDKFPSHRSINTDFYYFEATSNKSTKPSGSGANAADLILEGSAVIPYIKITKNFGFREIPEHSHAFIELNYMYSGQCTNIVNGVEYTMSAGDILIMDTNSTHRLGWTGENDILINMLILPEHAESAFMEMLTGESILSAFLVSAINQLPREPNHIYFHASDNPVLSTALTNLLCEYFDPTGAGANNLINCYVREIFTLLMRECINNPQNVETAYVPNSSIAQIITYMKDHCVTCTRSETAKRFGYSSNHLSQMLTRSTGKSFVQLRNEFRLNLVEQRLKTTSLPVKALAEEFGFTNATYFYKLYKEYFGKYPRSEE